jgi:putative NADPH-quinone reductase
LRIHLGDLGLVRQLLVLNGHPDPRPERFCAALCDAYERGAREGGWATERRDVGALGLGALSGQRGQQADQRAVDEMLAAIRRADRLIVIFPLWADEPPQMLQALLGRLSYLPDGAGLPEAHVIVTMDLPAFILKPAAAERGRADSTGYAVSLRGLPSRNVTVIGSVNAIGAERRRGWIDTMREYGMRAA